MRKGPNTDDQWQSLSSSNYLITEETINKAYGCQASSGQNQVRQFKLANKSSKEQARNKSPNGRLGSVKQGKNPKISRKQNMRKHIETMKAESKCLQSLLDIAESCPNPQFIQSTRGLKCIFCRLLQSTWGSDFTRFHWCNYPWVIAIWMWCCSFSTCRIKTENKRNLLWIIIMSQTVTLWKHYLSYVVKK